MANYTRIVISEVYISVSFDVGDDKVMAIGTRMNQMCGDAYMNGYNWDAFLCAYLSVNAPEILDIIEPDPEADMYSAYIDEVDEENKALAQKFCGIIDDLFNNEDKIYEFLRENADYIEWE